MLELDLLKKLEKNVKTIKKAIQELELLGFEIVIAKDVETMAGNLCDHVYAKYNLEKFVHLMTIFQKENGDGMD